MMLQYEKSDWVKVVYKNRVKRIYNPPKLMSDLFSIIKSRFKNIEREITADKTKDIALSYLDCDGDEINVEDARDLIEAYRYARMVAKDKVLKFLVKIYSKDPTEVEMV